MADMSADVLDVRQILKDSCYREGETEESLEDWLKSHRPSESRSAQVPWYWVRRESVHKETKKEEEGADSNGDAHDPEVMQASAVSLREELEKRVHEIDNDPAIPKVTTKKQRGKKAFREEVYSDISDRLHTLAEESGTLDGKWLLFPGDENVDTIWEKIVRGMIEGNGALRGTAVHTAKVAAGPNEGNRCICVYTPNAWNAADVKQVCVALMQDLGLSLSSYKADIYTWAGITSKNPSKIKSTLYNPKDYPEMVALMEERKEAKEAQKSKIAARSAEEEKAVVDQGGGFEDDSDDDKRPPAKKMKKN